VRALPASIQNNCTNFCDYNGLGCLTVAKCTTGAQRLFPALSNRCHLKSNDVCRRWGGPLLASSAGGLL
jgi:hypothetical protein